jgi:tRNA(Phe) wybutosine-synthesizing methylase Tyw3
MCSDISSAEALLRIKQSLGLKRGGIVSSSRRGYLVELISTTNLALPVSAPGVSLNRDYLQLIAKTANRLIGINKALMKKLEAALMQL